MADFTPNYNLEKPTGNEFYDVNVNTRNMDKIDTALKTNEGAQAKVDALAGVGNTKTVKQLSDEQAAHLADLVTDTDGVHGLKIESGIWTPTIAGTTTAGTNTYSQQAGNYYKTGKLVKATFRIKLSVKDAAMAGQIAINNLPFACNSSDVGRDGLSIALYSEITLGSGYTQLVGLLSPGETLILLYQGGSGKTFAGVMAGDITDTMSIFGSVIYTTN